MVTTQPEAGASGSVTPEESGKTLSKLWQLGNIIATGNGEFFSPFYDRFGFRLTRNLRDSRHVGRSTHTLPANARRIRTFPCTSDGFTLRQLPLANERLLFYYDDSHRHSRASRIRGICVRAPRAQNRRFVTRWHLHKYRSCLFNYTSERRALCFRRERDACGETCGK